MTALQLRKAVFLRLIVAMGTIFSTILIHALTPIAIIHYLRRARRLGRVGAGFWQDLTIVAGTTQLALVADLVEVVGMGNRLRLMQRIPGLCRRFLSLGGKLHYVGLGRYGHVGLVEIVGAARSGRRHAHVRRFNGDDLLP